MLRLGSAGAVDKQLDQLEKVFDAFTIVVLIVLFAAAAADKNVEFLGLKLETEEAHGIVILVFDSIFLIFVHLTWKIGDLIKDCEPAETEKALVSLFTHKWLLNPFSYSGKGVLSVINSALGTFLLGLSWWIGLAAYKLLLTLSKTPVSKRLDDSIPEWLYPAFAVIGMITCIRLFRIVILTSSKPASEKSNRHILRKYLLAAAWVKFGALLLGSLLGWMFLYATSHLGI